MRNYLNNGGLTQAQADARYLLLDASNDPITGDLSLDAGSGDSPLLSLISGTGDSKFTIRQKDSYGGTHIWSGEDDGTPRALTLWNDVTGWWTSTYLYWKARSQNTTRHARLGVNINSDYGSAFYGFLIDGNNFPIIIDGATDLGGAGSCVRIAYSNNGNVDFFASGGGNKSILQYGAIGGNARYAAFTIDDTDDYYHLSRDNSALKGFKVDMPLAIADLEGFTDADSDFTIILIPDAQNMTKSAPTKWTNLISWITDNKASLNIQAVIGLGDITDDHTTTEFDRAKTGYDNLMTAGLYVVPTIGNHDYNTASTRTSTTYDSYFGPSYFSGKTWYKGSRVANTNKDFYVEFTIGTHTYIVIAMEFYPEQATLTWAKEICDNNPTKEVIIVTHAYLNPAGARILDSDARGPNNYSFPNPHNGQEMWDELVRLCPNIILVVSGHYSVGDYVSHKSSIGDAGNTVHQIFSDYQNVDYGNGQVIILTFKPSTGEITRKSYSTDDSAYDSTYPTYTFRYGNIVVDSGLGVIGGVAITEDLEVKGYSLFGNAVRFQSDNAWETNTSFIDISIDASWRACFDAPDGRNLYFNYYHGSGSVYLCDGSGSGAYGDLWLDYLTGNDAYFSHRVQALEFYNGFIYPRHPDEGILHPDLDPPTFGEGQIGDICPPTMGTYDGCTSYDVDFREYACGSTYSPYSTIYYVGYYYITVDGTKYFSSSATQYSFTGGYCCTYFDVEIHVNNIGNGATGIRLYMSTDSGCSYNYYFDTESTGTWYDNSSSMWTAVDCSNPYPPANFLPVGTGGNINVEEYGGVCGYTTFSYGTTVYYRAYSYETLNGTKYFSTTYNETSVTISNGGGADVLVEFFSVVSGATGARLYRGLYDECQSAVVYNLYYDYEGGGTYSFYDNTSNAWSSGDLPSDFLPQSTGGDTIDNDTLWYSDDNDKFAYKDVNGDIRYLAWVA